MASSSSTLTPHGIPIVAVGAAMASGDPFAESITWDITTNSVHDLSSTSITWTNSLHARQNRTALILTHHFLPEMLPRELRTCLAHPPAQGGVYPAEATDLVEVFCLDHAISASIHSVSPETTLQTLAVVPVRREAVLLASGTVSVDGATTYFEQAARRLASSWEKNETLALRLTKLKDAELKSLVGEVAQSEPRIDELEVYTSCSALESGGLVLDARRGRVLDCTSAA